MADCEIRCITKSSLSGGHEYITHVGNPSSSPSWRWPVDDVIQSIDAKTNTFFVQDHARNKRADVGVVRPVSGRPYLRTYADGIWTDNLLALSTC
ncbi:DUF3892 domain-containing protein [Variovorax paradoxus]|uniref:DUF3892 domain-containing protein n=1 Tax=Variovorax paradoxus TaxID=34073 RepID=UPI001ABCD055